MHKAPGGRRREKKEKISTLFLKTVASPVERSGPATARLDRHAVRAGAGFQEVLHHREPPI